jgi:hypothetical protein
MNHPPAKALKDFDALMTPTRTFDEQDTALLTKLGLSSANLQLWEETSLGQVTLPHNIQVSVRATVTPATFFKFDFYFQDTQKRYRADTGSGDFRTYWRMAKRFAKEKRDRQDPLFEITEGTSEKATY